MGGGGIQCHPCLSSALPTSVCHFAALRQRDHELGDLLTFSGEDCSFRSMLAFIPIPLLISSAHITRAVKVYISSKR